LKTFNLTTYWGKNAGLYWRERSFLPSSADFNEQHYLDKPMVLTMTGRSRQTNLIALLSDIYGNQLKLAQGGQPSRLLQNHGFFYEIKSRCIFAGSNFSHKSNCGRIVE